MLLILGLLLWQEAAVSDQKPASTEAPHDYVQIGFIPARAKAFQGEPYMKMEARVLALHKSDQIKTIFDDIKKVVDGGITDNATQFHQPTIYLDVHFQGESLRIFYSGESGQERFEAYETQWRALHARIYAFLNADLAPAP